MFEHLRPLLTQKITVQRRDEAQQDSQWQSVPITVREAFNIQETQEAAFFTGAAEALAHFHPERVQDKFKKKMSLESTPLPCSFIPIASIPEAEGGLYALSKDIIGFCAFGYVKLGMRIDKPETQLVAIKIQHPVSPREGGERRQRMVREGKIGFSYGFFLHPIHTRKYAGKEGVEKYYYISRYAGITLCQWQQDYQPSTERRLEVAIHICQLIGILHQKGYAFAF